jgi:putative hydrolase of the HAD superfamily
MTHSLLFDFGGTLDSDGQPWIDRFYALYQELGVDVPRQRFDRAFHDSDDNLAKRYSLTGASLEQTVSFQVGEVLKSLASDRGELAPLLTRRFLDGCRTHFSRNSAVLRRLAKRFRLGVVSNFYGNLESVLASEGLAQYFSVLADSAVLGHSKPGAEIFQHALRALDCRPQDCLMIGDSIARDMRGAEGLGLPHALLSGGGDNCCAKGMRLKTLPEIEELLCAAA